MSNQEIELAADGDLVAAAKRRRILFALPGEARPTESLRRAYAIALLLDADLFIERVLPEPKQLGPFFARMSGLDTYRVPDMAQSPEIATQAWIHEALGDMLPEQQVDVQVGPFLDTVARQAVDLRPDLIVIPPQPGAFGNLVIKLAHIADVPVLVARAATSHEEIVVATDLAETDTPVLRTAAEFASFLHAHVVALHSMAPIPPGPMLDPNWSLPFTLESEQYAMRGLRLERAAAKLAIDVETVVACEANPVDAILGEARTRDADLVIVGSHPRGWLGRLWHRNVAARVINQADRSVLVMPLHSPLERSRVDKGRSTASH